MMKSMHPVGLRLVASLTMTIVVGGCAEHNFVPGSPMARLFGYHRSYEQIAADDCANQFKFARDGEMHKQCINELSMARRKNDAAYMEAAGRMAQTGFAMMQAQQPETSQHTYIIDGRTITCSQVNNATACNKVP
jgi:hypothetical protein